MNKRERPRRPIDRKPALPSAAPAKPAQPKSKRRRITDSLIALSSAAIFSVYTIGYVHTDSAENQVSAQEIVTTAAPASSPASSPSAAPTLGQRPTSTTAAPTPTQAGKSVAQAQAKTYRDGTYTGTGNSRHGSIEVTVVVKSGQIASADISRCGTRYSCSYVTDLVDEVVTRQAVPVDHISRATDSSNAYKQAVASALAQAS